MRGQLTSMQREEYHRQWADEKFLPVQNMIDELL